jgi:ADP-heptose:LPS heptosyltransferase
VRERSRSIQRILLIQLYGLGDVLLTTPAVRAVRRQFPEARIDYLTLRLGADAIAGNPHLDEVLLYPYDEKLPWWFIREIRKRRYDAIIDFRSIPRTATLIGFSGARIRSGLRARGPRNLAYTDLVPKLPPLDLYLARRNLQMLAPLGIDAASATDLSLDLAVSDAERQWADEFWSRYGLATNRPVVAISAVSELSYKNWGAARWSIVAEALLESGAQVILTHGPNERPQVEAVVGRMRSRPVWGEDFTSVRQMAALYQRCALWLGNDGGPKHVAVAMGVPTVSVFRWTFGPNWTDTSSGTANFVLEKAPPQGCDLNCAACAHLGCLSAVEPAEVIFAAHSVLGGRADRKESHVLPVLETQARSGSAVT